MEKDTYEFYSLKESLRVLSLLSRAQQGYGVTKGRSRNTERILYTSDC